MSFERQPGQFSDLSRSFVSEIGMRIEPGPDRRAADRQVEQARQIIGDRPIDLVTLSIGGNDVGFTNILAACATVPDCPVRPAPTGRLARYQIGRAHV